MTEDQKKIIDNFFTRYGNPSDMSEHNYRLYYTRPAAIIDPKWIMREDKKADDDIKRLESAIESLKTLRLALAERYNELYQAPSVPVVRLKREKNSYSNKVFYYLSTFRRYDDGKETPPETTKFPGTERAAAIAAYKTYIKQHPGIVAEMDIQKGRWEH